MKNDRSLMSYESLFNKMTTNEEKSVEKIYNVKNKSDIKRVLNSKKYNKKLFKDILYSFENNKDINKKTSIIDKVKYGIKPGKQWIIVEDISDKKDKFIQRYTCTYFFSYHKNFKAGKEVVYEVMDKIKKDVGNKCKSFEPLVKKVYPSSKAKLDFSVNEDKMNDETVASLLIAYFEIYIPLSFFFNDKSSESFVNEKIEQNHIIPTRTSNFFSIEDDGGSFEDAAGGDDGGYGGEGNGSPDGGAVEEPPEMDMSMNDMDGGGDGGWDDGSGGGDEGGFDDGSGEDENGEGGNDDKKDVFDSNIGASMNPFTQINQKLYQLEALNELRLSIKKTIDMYNSNYADWSEVCQLKELLKILDEERKSFMMQQNPENLLKLGLYHEQYDKLVQNISKRISKLAANDRQ
jgi:hypothetical protein